MTVGTGAWWGASFFLVGVLVANLSKQWPSQILLGLLVAVLIAATLFIFGARRIGLLSLFIAVGSFYAIGLDLFWESRELIPFKENVTVTGVVVKTQNEKSRQEAVVKLDPPQHGRVIITTRPFPEIQYGDRLRLEGKISPPEGRRAARLQKDRVGGTMNFPRLEIIARGEGSMVMATLLKLKESVREKYDKALSPFEARFLAGLTLGERPAPDEELSRALQRSGTSHLVALSGYNVAILVQAVVTVLSGFLRRRSRAAVAVIAVIFFVLMTGAEASVVRAAIMGVLVVLAREAYRPYSLRNAITFAALGMTLWNPRILLWDIGFQLSFAAVLGLAYLEPALRLFLKIKPESGMLGWRGNLWTTIAAQLAVLPLLLSYFGFFPIIGVLVNPLVILAVPLTMFLGFALAAIGFVSTFLSSIIGVGVAALISYEIGVITLGARFPVAIAVSGLAWPLGVCYYAAVLAFVFYVRKRAVHE